MASQEMCSFQAERGNMAKEARVWLSSEFSGVPKRCVPVKQKCMERARAVIWLLEFNGRKNALLGGR